MKRPNLDDHGNTFQYSGYQDKYIDHLESQLKESNKLYSASFLMWITGIKTLSALKKKYDEYKNQIEK